MQIQQGLELYLNFNGMLIGLPPAVIRAISRVHNGSSQNHERTHSGTQPWFSKTLEKIKFDYPLINLLVLS